MAALIPKERQLDSDDHEQIEKSKLEMDSLAVNLTAALTSVGDDKPTSGQSSTTTSSIANIENLSNSTSDQEIFFNENSLESFNSQLHGLISTSKQDLPLLDNNFSVLNVIYESKEKLICKHPVILDVKARLLKLLHDSGECSYQVFVGKYKFHCHLAVLQAHSKYFLLYGKPDKLITHLPMEHVTPPAFNAIYNWMIGSKKEKGKRSDSFCRNFVELLSAVHFLQIRELKELCWSVLNKPEITENVAFALAQEATRFDLPDFMTMMFARISKFFLTLVASQEFLELQASLVCKLLAMHNLGVNNEIEIFMSALRWLAHSWPNRHPHMVTLMHSVRFGLLPPLFLRFLQKEQQTEVMDCICRNSEVQEMINQAFVYASTELFSGDIKQRLPYLLPDYDLPEQRKWICDKECSYHHDSNRTQRQFFTYQQFLNYLQAFQKKAPSYWQQLPLLRDVCRSDK